MNTIPKIIDIAPALRLLAEKYPNEEVQIETRFNRKAWEDENRMPLHFVAWVGDEHDVFANGNTAMEAANALIEAAGTRDTQAKLKARIEKAKEALRDAERELENARLAAIARLESAPPAEPSDITITETP